VPVENRTISRLPHMRFRVACLAVMLSVAACDKTPTGPSSPLAPRVDLQRLELEVVGPGAIPRSPWGEAVVVRPGDTVQFRVRGYLPDGSSRDITSQASWVWVPSGDNNFLGQFAVHNGLVSAPACPGSEACRSMGAWEVIANYFSQAEVRRSVLVMTEGSFAVRGYVTEAVSGRPVSNALVELRDSPGSFQHLTRTADDGRFRALGVPNGAELRVSKGDDYDPIRQSLILNNSESQLDFALSRKACGGVVPVFAPPMGVITEINDQLPRCLVRAYDVTVPSNGTLVGRLTWNPESLGARLTLALGSAVFPASPPKWSPVVGRLEVSAGQTYRVEVYEGENYWGEYGDPFVLTISLE
jgi:hypothetical protein